LLARAEKLLHRRQEIESTKLVLDIVMSRFDKHGGVVCAGVGNVPEDHASHCVTQQNVFFIPFTASTGPAGESGKGWGFVL
jgi:hypothetical protein